jgi:hypothetical protein
MMCPSPGDLRSYLDGESQSLAPHIEMCAQCRQALQQLRNSADSVKSILGAMDVGVPDSSSAYRHFVSQHPDTERVRVFRRPVWVGAAAVAALAALFSFAPARSWGQRILTMLRVEKVAVIPVDLDVVGTAAHGREKLISQMISDRVVVTMKPGKPAIVTDAEAASAAAGYPVRTLDALGNPTQIRVRDEAAFHLEVDRDRILALLEGAGRSDISIPAAVDGSEIAVHIPKAVHMEYGQCSGSGREECIHFVQVPSPIISVPPNLDIATLAEAALQVAGLSAADAHAFSQSVDWSSTLVIPVPQNGSTFRNLAVDGVSGTLIENAPHGRFAGEYALVWVKNRRVYSLTGIGNSSRALAVAESLN